MTENGHGFGHPPLSLISLWLSARRNSPEILMVITSIPTLAGGGGRQDFVDG